VYFEGLLLSLSGSTGRSARFHSSTSLFCFLTYCSKKGAPGLTLLWDFDGDRPPVIGEIIGERPSTMHSRGFLSKCHGQIKSLSSANTSSLHNYRTSRCAQQVPHCRETLALPRTYADAAGSSAVSPQRVAV